MQQRLPGPSFVQATNGLPGLAAVAWNSVPDADQYQVARSTTQGQRGSVLGSTKSLSFDDTTAVPGTTYWYSVQARKRGGSWGQWSLTQVSGSASPLVTTPPTITGFTASPPSVAVIGKTVILSASIANATSLTLDGVPVTLPAAVTPTTTHTYTLVAIGAGGTATASATVTVTLPPSIS